MFGGVKQTKRRSITIVSAVATTSIFFNWLQSTVDTDEVPTASQKRFDHFHNFIQFINYKRASYLNVELDQSYLRSKQYLIRSICQVASADAGADEVGEVSSSPKVNLSEPAIKIEGISIESNEDDGVQSNIDPLEDEDDEKVWNQKAENCGFCRYFLISPCAEPFKAWSLCVDKAKAENADFVSQCAERTAALMECTSSNSAYFNQPTSSEESESESVDDEETIPEVEAEATSSNSDNSPSSESVSIEPEGDAKKE